MFDQGVTLYKGLSRVNLLGFGRAARKNIFFTFSFVQYLLRIQARVQRNNCCLYSKAYISLYSYLRLSVVLI